MNHNLTDNLLSGFKSIKKEFLSMGDEESRKMLILKTCREVSAPYDEQIASNAVNIVSYYLSSSKVEIDELINFLATNSDIDNITAEREERDGFDAAFGTTTSLILRQYELPEKISLQRFQSSGRCHPTPVTSMKMALEELKEYGVRYDEYVFVDVGSGLGRNLLLASAYPFLKVVGIEHSGYLVAKTKENIKIYEEKTGRACNLEVLCIDALKYDFPRANIVFYFWRPFSDEIADAFVKKIEKFILDTSFRVILVFLGMVYPGVKKCSQFHLINIFYTPDLIAKEGDFFPVSVFSSTKL